jgi:hypothetical protein
MVVFSCGQNTGSWEVSEKALLITNVNIVDVRNGNIQTSMQVLIDSGTIKVIQKEEIKVNQSIDIIEGDDKYLMPGLAEMHAHIPSPQWGRDRTDETLFLYLSNGITTIRGMLGHPVHLELREKALRNEILSPRIFTSSPSLNGNTVRSVEEANEKVTQYWEEGYDFLKLHPGIQRDVFDEIVSTARKVGIPYAGHVSVDVGIRHALSNQYATVDHVDGFLEGLVPEDLELDPTTNGFFGYNFTELADTSMIKQLVQMTVDHKVWVVPTQSLFDRWFSPQDPGELANAPEMQYMPKSILESWIKSKSTMIQSTNYSEEKWIRFNAIRRSLINKINEDGFGLLLGSDAPQVFNVPGFSIHHEMKGMRLAGVSNEDIIRSGTLNPAIFFGMEGQFGEVINGAIADLILINGNPFDDLENMRDPEAVIVRGRYISQEEIAKRLQDIAERSQNI